MAELAHVAIDPRTQIAAIQDPKDAADFARKCEAAAKLYASQEAKADEFYEAAIYARKRFAELIAAGREAGVILNNGKSPLPASSFIANPRDISRSEKLRLAGDSVLEAYFSQCRESGKRITTSGAIAAAKKHLRDQSLKARESQKLPTGCTVTAKQDVVPCDAVITPPSRFHVDTLRIGSHDPQLRPTQC